MMEAELYATQYFKQKKRKQSEKFFTRMFERTRSNPYSCLRAKTPS